jgi:hypothetical protein
MATFYVGPRPVLKGRTTAGMVHPYKGTVGKYSFWENWSTSHVLDGAPDNNYIPGTGKYPGNRLLSQIFNGTVLYVHPLSGTFQNGSKYTGSRYRPLEYKGLAGAAAFTSGYGHDANAVSRYSLYSNFKFDGVPSADVMTNVGHGVRAYGSAGVASSFGYFIPEEFHGVTSTTVFTSGYGQGLPVGYNNAYGKNKVNEYRGLPSARAL